MFVKDFTIYTEGDNVTVSAIITQDVEFTINVRLVKHSKISGRTFVHKSCMGAVLEWLTIETMGTVYQVRPEDLQRFSDCLNASSEHNTFYFMPV